MPEEPTEARHRSFCSSDVAFQEAELNSAKRKREEAELNPASEHAGSKRPLEKAASSEQAEAAQGAPCVDDRARLREKLAQRKLSQAGAPPPESTTDRGAGARKEPASEHAGSKRPLEKAASSEQAEAAQGAPCVDDRARKREKLAQRKLSQAGAPPPESTTDRGAGARKESREKKQQARQALALLREKEREKKQQARQALALLREKEREKEQQARQALALLRGKAREKEQQARQALVDLRDFEREEKAKQLQAKLRSLEKEAREEKAKQKKEVREAAALQKRKARAQRQRARQHKGKIHLTEAQVRAMAASVLGAFDLPQMQGKCLRFLSTGNAQVQKWVQLLRDLGRALKSKRKTKVVGCVDIEGTKKKAPYSVSLIAPGLDRTWRLNPLEGGDSATFDDFMVHPEP